MHSPAIITAMLFATIGIPASAAFLILLLISIFFRRTRAFAWRLFFSSLATGLAAAALMWLASQSSLPHPYDYQAALSVFPFGFGVGGLIFFFKFYNRSKQVAITPPL